MTNRDKMVGLMAWTITNHQTGNYKFTPTTTASAILTALSSHYDFADRETEVVVPREPTEVMADAALHRARQKDLDCMTNTAGMQEIIKAAIAAYKGESHD